ncbi:hypothetical protein [Streptomyces sp. TR06-5]|uniref:hypothetical protein n=1 Tax=unclassified Streptomyces TaxID=2593676 RepID=UPI0039A055D7
MKARRSGTVRSTVCLLAAVLLGPLGCAPGPGSGPAGQGAPVQEKAAQALFDRRAAAVRAADPQRFLGTVDPRARTFLRRQRLVAANLARLHPVSWRYDLRRLDRDGDRPRAEVELSYRLTRDTDTPRHLTQRFSLRRTAGRWLLGGHAGSTRRQLWEQGRLRVEHGRRSTVLGTVDRATLRGVARRAERAVSAVSRHWPEPWSRRTLVLVPASLRDMAELLGGEPSRYAGLAAVTTGPSASTTGEGRHIVVNPEAFQELSDRGRQVVLTHETAHVATRARTGPGTPLWLSEGLADWFGHLGTGTDPAAAAPVLTRSVRDGRVPRTLPADGRFQATGDPDAPALAYEGAWMACRLVADRWGSDRLAALYTAVGAGKGAPRAVVDRALRDVLGVDTAAFTRLWRSALRQQLSR